ncbi:MAG: hypothetical protein GQ574_23515 [Crocinitomix sp.]|nr:hypothetical protein [Crocinitomix sp.]
MKLIRLSILLIAISALFSMLSVDSAGKITYDQTLLYQTHNIDSVLIKHSSSHYDEFDHVNTVKIINDLGYCVKTTNFCSNGNLMNVKEYSRKGAILKSTAYEFECNGKRDSETIYVYLKSRHIQTLISNNLKTYKLSESWNYDLHDRLVDYANYRFSDTAWWEHTDYDTLRNTSFLFRIKGYDDRDTIFTTEKYFNTKGQPTKSINRYDHVIKSIYQYEYDEFGNLKQKHAHFYPSDKLGVDQQYFYSSPHKLDSTWWLSGMKSDIYNKTYYEYDQRGLLIKETHYDNRNNKVDTKHYEYK